MSSKLQEMFSLTNWAVVGATTKEERFGYKILMLLVERGYTVYGINPKYDKINGLTIYNTLTEVINTDHTIDVINMIVDPDTAKDILLEGHDLGIDKVFFQPGSYTKETIDYAKSLNYDIIMDCVWARLR